MSIGNDIEQGIIDVSNLFALQFKKRKDRDVVISTTNAFKNEYIEFFNNNEMPSNATQIHKKKLALIKNRLDTKGIFMETIIAPIKREENSTPITWRSDKKYLSASVLESVCAKKKFYSGSQLLASSNRYNTAEYTVVDSNIAGTDFFSCPNCGAEQNPETNNGTCEYCQTKFTINNFYKKISSFSLQKDYARLFGEAFYFFPILVVVGILSMFLGQIFEGIIFLSSLPMLIFIAMIVLFILYEKAVFAEVAANRKSGKSRIIFERKIRTQDPYFSTEMFLANLENKLVLTHFAASYRNVSPFMKQDITPIINGYNNVLDCELSNCNFLAFSNYNSVQSIDLSVTLNLLVLNNVAGKKPGIQKQKETISLQLIRDASYITPPYNDPFSLQCASCGAPIDILEGGLCNHCGYATPFEKYDWLITNYNTSNVGKL